MQHAYATTPSKPLDPRTEREAKDREVARAHQSAMVEQAATAEAAGRVEAAARALPDSLFDADPEIRALRADHEVKKRQREPLAFANPEALNTITQRLKERIKGQSLEAAIAAVEDVMAGDATLARAMVLQRQVDDDERRLAVLTVAMDRLNRFGFSALARERVQLAEQALAAALMERKRQYLREHPEGPSTIGSEQAGVVEL